MKTSYKLWIILFVFAFVLNAFNVIQPIAKSETWENEFGKLEVYPDYDYNACFHEHFANITWYKEPAYIDVAFRFEIQLNNPNIYYYHNYSHPKKINDYENIEYNYTLTNISDFQQIEEPNDVDFGDIPSDYYYNGYVILENESVNYNIGFDSFNWLNQEHTSAIFFFHIIKCIGFHYENISYFDWHNINHLWQHQEYNNKHYYYFQHWAITNQTYHIKFNFNTLINTNGKWDFLAKYSNETISYAIQHNRIIEICPFWNSDWGYYKRITLNNPLRNYQIRLQLWKSKDINDATNSTFNLSNHCNANFSDIRFIYNNITELPYYIENHTNNVFCNVWVNTSDLNVSWFDLYYGNPSAINNSDGNATFFFFDDFLGNDINNTIWEIFNAGAGRSYTVSNSILNISTDANNVNYGIGTQNSYPNKKVIIETLTKKIKNNYQSDQVCCLETSNVNDIPPNEDDGGRMYYRTVDGWNLVDYVNSVQTAHIVTVQAVGSIQWIVRLFKNTTYVKSELLYRNYTSVAESSVYDVSNNFNPYINIWLRDVSGDETIGHYYWVRMRNYSDNETNISSCGDEVSRTIPVELILIIYPLNNSINVCPCCFEVNITVSSNASMNITIYSNYTGNWIFINSYINITNGSYGIMIFNFTKYNWDYYINITLWEFNNDSNYNKSLIKYTTAQYINCSSDAILSESEELFLSNPFDVEPDILALGIIMFFFWLGYSKKDYVLTWFTSIMLLVMFVYFIVQFNAIDFIISLCLIGIAIYGFVKGFSFMVESLIEKEGRET